MKLSQIIPEKATITQGQDKEEMAYLQQAANFLSDHLNLESHDISISLDPPSSVADFNDAQTGLTIGIGPNPKKIFVMLRKNMSTGEKVRAMAHEMVHAEQLATGKLILNIEGGRINAYWKPEDRTYENVKYKRSHPWELEAHAREKELHRLTIETLGNFTA